MDPEEQDYDTDDLVGDPEIEIEVHADEEPTEDLKNDRGAKQLAVEDFELLGVLGRGAYGKVFQVRKKKCGKIYAMKVLRKKEVIKRKVVPHTKAEREVLEEIDHPFIVNLSYAFQTPSKLYLIMDYVGGGELFTRLDEELELDEDASRLYAAEVILALEHLHSKDIIYRDLKPENILFDMDGHIRLADFGFAKKQVVEDQGTKTFCGTVHYMAPEIVGKTGHGKPADWWAVGILLFEMLTGRTPFHDQNRKTIQKNILNQKLKVPSWISPVAASLIKSLLKKTISARLGTNGAADIKKHPFFDKINWEDVKNRKVVPEFKPSVSGPLDTSNFDEKFTAEAAIDSPCTPGDLNMFPGFSYSAPSPLLLPKNSPAILAQQRKSSISSALGSPSFGPRLGHPVTISNHRIGSPWVRPESAAGASPPRLPSGSYQKLPPRHPPSHKSGQSRGSRGSHDSTDSRNSRSSRGSHNSSCSPQLNSKPINDHQADGRGSFNEDEMFSIATGAIKKKKTRRGGKKKKKKQEQDSNAKKASPVESHSSVGKTSKLNPNAKVFQFNPNAKPFDFKPTIFTHTHSEAQPKPRSQGSPVRQMGFQTNGCSKRSPSLRPANVPSSVNAHSSSSALGASLSTGAWSNRPSILSTLSALNLDQ